MKQIQGVSFSEHICALCFNLDGTLEPPTFDVKAWNSLVLTDVCIPCRIGETYWMIRKYASYD